MTDLKRVDVAVDALWLACVSLGEAEDADLREISLRLMALDDHSTLLSYQGPLGTEDRPCVCRDEIPC